MPVNTWRGSVAATAVAAFLALTLTSTPSISSIATTPTLGDLDRPPLGISKGPQSRALSFFKAESRDQVGTPLAEVAFDAAPNPRAARLQQRFVANLPHGRAIEDAARKSGLDSLLIASVAEAESGFESSAVSIRGAVGLMQILPETAAMFGVERLDEPSANLQAGSQYLANLLAQFDGNLEHALAAYNAGPGVVERFGGIPPYRETQAYVRRVLGLYRGHQERIAQASARASGYPTTF